jgi:hypothetical protein
VVLRARDQENTVEGSEGGRIEGGACQGAVGKVAGELSFVLARRLFVEIRGWSIVDDEIAAERAD